MKLTFDLPQAFSAMTFHEKLRYLRATATDMNAVRFVDELTNYMGDIADDLLGFKCPDETTCDSCGKRIDLVMEADIDVEEVHASAYALKPSADPRAPRDKLIIPPQDNKKR